MTLDLIHEPAGGMVVLPAETISQRETDHRVANSLQLISSLLSVQARHASDDSVRDALVTAIHRIGAVGAVHKQLHHARSPNSIDIASYLFDLAEAIEQTFCGGIGRKHISAHIQGRMVSADFASVLGILVTELVTNSCKHAYAPDEPRDIEICLFFPALSAFRMEVRDYGGQPDDHLASRQPGLGTSIIDAMCCKLNATYAYVIDEEGTRFVTNGRVL
ncbi:sensor histidine kinase [Sphingobium chungangianum]